MSRRRIKKAIVNYDNDGNIAQIEATYFDEVEEGGRVFSTQENQREAFDDIPKKEQTLTKKWIKECVTPMLVRQDVPDEKEATKD